MFISIKNKVQNLIFIFTQNYFMTITQLQYVLAVAQFKNFTVAAEKCFVTQPSLSMQIQKLEEELQIQIFDRTKKPIQLTEIGEKIVSQAKNIVDEANRIKDIVEQQKGYIGGEFKIGIIPTIAPTLLPMFLNNFITKYPKLNLRIEELNTQDIIKKLNQRELDVAIAATPLFEEKIKEVPLYYEPFTAYIPKNHHLHTKKNIEVTDLNIDEILLLQDGHCFRDNIINLCKNKAINGQKERFQLESGSFETLTKLADEGLGITLLPYLHSLQIGQQNKENIKNFSKPNPAREVSLIYHKNELKVHIIEALKKVIQGVIKGAIVFQDVAIISPTQKSNA